MKLLVGLGNPGPKYLWTRHNAGFIILDLLAAQLGVNWEDSKKFTGLTGRALIAGSSCFLLKPMTYMNLSGKSVAAFCQFHKIEPEEIVVIHDDIDLQSCKVKGRAGGGGHGGHNGIRSMTDELGSAGFARIKVGVGRPPLNDAGHPIMAVESWVLAPFSDAELQLLRNSVLTEVVSRLK